MEADEGDQDQFLKEIVRRMEAVTLGVTFKTRHGCVPLTSQEKDRLDSIAKSEGLATQELIDRYFENRL